MRHVLFIIPLVLFACARAPVSDGWTTLIDGARGLENFDRVGDARWRAEGGAIVGDGGTWHSFLVSRRAYGDFQLRAEFRAQRNTNSGIHVRAQDPANVTPKNSYEVNIFDRAPAPEFGTGSIVGFAKVNSLHTAADRWSTYVITAKGATITAELNGVRTVELRDSTFARGYIALQWGVLPKDVPGGRIEWRKVRIREF
ncbi:MAG TPA: DUF1080 domain-containing protein [Burkholderiales bacterium]|nr:DUF1080 domain-containing protein [Burkholderiales bacterium]